MMNDYENAFGGRACGKAAICQAPEYVQFLKQSN